MSALDWGNGAYEVFSPSLQATAARLVQLAAPQFGERAVDLGCGDGNATLPLAASGAHVTAVDPSLRLLGVADSRARAADRRIQTVQASAESLPLPGGDADLVISNFAVIFSQDPPAAIKEILRILTPDGRFLYSAWKPEGPIAEIGQLMRQAFEAPAPAGVLVADGEGSAPAPTDPRSTTADVQWHEPPSLAHLIPGGRDAMIWYLGEAEFVHESASAWIAEAETNHPMWMAAREQLGDEDRWRELMDQSEAVLAAASKADDRLVLHSPYVIGVITPIHASS